MNNEILVSWVKSEIDLAAMTDQNLVDLLKLPKADYVALGLKDQNYWNMRGLVHQEIVIRWLANFRNVGG
jgi:hypothetical protein